MTDKVTAKAKIAELIAKYEALSPARRRALSEMDTRRIFILPLFDALCWDTTGNPDEVAEEVSGAAGRADYAFRIGGITRFLLEAKAVHVNLDRPEHAIQAVSYAYNRGVPWAVLSDFEGLKVYYAEWEVDEVAHCRVTDLRYDEYLEEFDLLWRLSKPAFREDALRKYAERRYGVVGRRTPVGDHLLAQFVRWREELFRYFWQYNHDRGYSLPQIDEAIQRLLDRLIFIRTCEDRRIEEPRLLPLLRGREGGALEKDLWGLLLDLFREFDGTYDSRLFEHHLVDSLACDETPFRTLLEGLYFSAGPVRYQFDVIPADVLGRVYEQYLGFVAQTAKEVAKKEAAQAALPGFEPGPDRTIELVSKKLKRKRHGIYYTPQFVVDYIVEQTLERVLEERSLDEVRDLAVLDMACGSGSFLITAYERLLRHHAEAQQQPALPQEERLEILTRNVYGVDLDAQAVEVAQLNLLLKALEEPGDLPNLNSNVKRGNSLVEGGAKELEPYFGENWRTLARPLNWRRAFPQAMKRGGFDVIVGNPPWLMAGYYVGEQLEYLRDRFETARGKFDLYYLFIEQAYRVLAPGGYLGMIVPNKLFHTRAASALRAMLASSGSVQQIVDFGDAQLFEGATNYSCILILHKGYEAPLRYVRATESLEVEDVFTLPQESLRAKMWHFERPEVRLLFEKMETCGVPLETLVRRFGSGVQSGADRILMAHAQTAKARGLEEAVVRPVLRGRDVRRYRVSPVSKLLVFPYGVVDDEFVILGEEELQQYAQTYSLLADNKAKLAKRVWFGKGAVELSGEWYGMMYLDSYWSFAAPHLLTPSLSNQANFALGTGDLFVTGTAGVTSIIPVNQDDLLYLLGLLNSKLMSLYAIGHSPVFSGGYYKFSAPYLRSLPIRRVDFDDPAQVAQHDAIVARVEELLHLYARRAELPEIDERAAVQAAIDAEEAALDALVYELYGLTEEEIALVEEQ